MGLLALVNWSHMRMTGFVKLYLEVGMVCSVGCLCLRQEREHVWQQSGRQLEAHPRLGLTSGSGESTQVQAAPPQLCKAGEKGHARYNFMERGAVHALVRTAADGMLLR